MFEVLIVKPIFNLLVLIYALLPGHNFGLALLVFTVVVRLLMWPLIKKQLHHAKAMRELQPEIKRIKKAAGGDRQKESMMLMALYKEREISPFGSLGVLVVQVVILLGLYSGLRRVVDNPQAVVDYSYSWIRDLSWLKVLAQDIHRFDGTFLGIVDLTRAALPSGGSVYWPAMIIVAGSAVSQYYQSKQLMPSDGETRSLKQILREAGSGKQADQSEVSAATGRTMRFFIPILVFVFTIGLPAALGLYWLISGITAYLQQARILGQDKAELSASASTSTSGKTVIEGEVIDAKPKSKKKKPSASNKRRRK